LVLHQERVLVCFLCVLGYSSKSLWWEGCFGIEYNMAHAQLCKLEWWIVVDALGSKETANQSGIRTWHELTNKEVFLARWAKRLDCCMSKLEEGLDWITHYKQQHHLSGQDCCYLSAFLFQHDDNWEERQTKRLLVEFKVALGRKHGVDWLA
jgi:hypothetical protein